MDRRSSLQFARELYDAEKYDAAFNLCHKWLTDDPNDIDALLIASMIFYRKHQNGIAYQLARRCVELAPNDATTLLNLGAVCDVLQMPKEAKAALMRGLEKCRDDRTKVLILNNICAMLVSAGEFDEAEFFGRKAQELDKGHVKSLGNIGFCQLAKRQWVPGWKNYHHAIGQYWRKKKVYGEEPEWDGSPGKTIVVYGEQGIGDEICFASVLQEAIDVSEKVIVDCHEKLEGLFTRSFPQARVYGTKQVFEDLPWAEEDRQFDASIPIGQLGEFFRLTDQSFHGKPFLVPDPDRVLMWKSLFATKGKPVIGIAWTGGLPHTGSKLRAAPLEDWLPLFEAIDAHFVCLQYKDASLEIDEFREKRPEVDLVEYPYATLTDDYDDTAALVAALDCVVSVPTAVVHLAGAIGTPVVMLKAKVQCWKTASGLPFHPLLSMVDWQGNWRDSIAKSVKHVEEICSAVLSDTTRGNLLPPMSVVPASNDTLLSRSA